MLRLFKKKLHFRIIKLIKCKPQIELNVQKCAHGKGPAKTAQSIHIWQRYPRIYLTKRVAQEVYVKVKSNKIFVIFRNQFSIHIS